MTLEYKLHENDYLQYQLFLATKNKSVRNQRIRVWLMLAIGFLLIGLTQYSKDRFGSYILFISSAIILLFYPFYQRYYYKRHYQKFNAGNYKERFGQSSVLNFHTNDFEIVSPGMEAKFEYSALERIDEIGNYFFLEIKTGGGIIVPKKHIGNMEEFESLMDKIIHKYSLEKNTELNWKWK